MANKDYYSFEEALKDLQMEEGELKRLVSAGEIRAFRDKQTMRFKAEDIARLKAADSADIDDLDLDLDLDLEDAGDDDLAGLELGDGEAGTGGDADLGDDAGLGNDAGLGDDELIDLGAGGDELVLEDETAGELELVDLDAGPAGGGDVEEFDLGAAAAGGGRAARDSGDGGLRTRRKVGVDARAVAAATEAQSDSPLVLATLCVSFVLLLLASFTVFSAVAGHANATNEWIVSLFS